MARVKLESSTHVTWEKVGQTVEGTLLKVEMTGGNIKGKIARLRADDGSIFTVSCPTLLAQMLEDNFAALEGALVSITFTGEDKPKTKGQSGLKRFDVEYDDGGDAE